MSIKIVILGWADCSSWGWLLWEHHHTVPSAVLIGFTVTMHYVGAAFQDQLSLLKVTRTHSGSALHIVAEWTWIVEPYGVAHHRHWVTWLCLLGTSSLFLASLFIFTQTPFFFPATFQCISYSFLVDVSALRCKWPNAEFTWLWYRIWHILPAVALLSLQVLFSFIQSETVFVCPSTWSDNN